MLEPWSFSQIKKVSYSDQELIFKSNSSVRPFSILRIEWAHGAKGYSCLSPLAHLHDPTVAELQRELLHNIKSGGEGISSLNANGVSGLLIKSLDFNYNFQSILQTVDAEFFGIANIRHNFLVSDLQSFSQEELQNALAEGFESFKFKLQPRLLDLFFQKLQKFKNYEIQIRLDFNGSLSGAQYVQFADRLDREFLQNFDQRKAQLEYIEDPCSFQDLQQLPFDRDLLFQIPIFLDNEWVPTGRELHPVVKGLVLKPAAKKLEQSLAVARFLKLELRFTSYMDHDLGVLQSLAEIMRLKNSQVDETLRKENQGFLTGDLFQAFSGQIFKSKGPYLVLSEDYKSRLQKYFEGLTWTDLL